MSKGVNKAIIIGNATRDPEIRYMSSGGAVANLSMATSESWKDKNTGNKETRAEYHKIVAFGKLAEIVEQYVKKGTKLYIEGSLRTRKWQGQDGQDRYTTEIVASDMQMLDSKQTNPMRSEAPSADGSKPNSQAADFDPSDDIPF